MSAFISAAIWSLAPRCLAFHQTMCSVPIFTAQIQPLVAKQFTYQLNSGAQAARGNHSGFAVRFNAIFAHLLHVFQPKSLRLARRILRQHQANMLRADIFFPHYAPENQPPQTGPAVPSAEVLIQKNLLTYPFLRFRRFAEAASATSSATLIKRPQYSFEVWLCLNRAFASISNS